MIAWFKVKLKFSNQTSVDVGFDNMKDIQYSQ